MKRGNNRGLLPFLDLLFILLFSLLALSETRSSASREPVRIRLPQVAPGNAERPDEERPTVVVEIDGESRIRVQGTEETIDSPAQLDAVVEALFPGRPPAECRVEIHGDTNARHGVSVALLQHLRQRGFASVTLLATGGDGADWTPGAAR